MRNMKRRIGSQQQSCVIPIFSVLAILTFLLFSLFLVQQKLSEVQRDPVIDASHHLKQEFQRSTSTSTSTSNISTRNLKRTASSLHAGTTSRNSSIDKSRVAVQPQDNNNNDNDDDDDDDGYYFHVVFSSGCNALQDWQTYAFFHSILDSGFAGNVTRVASCETAREAEALQHQHEEQIQIMSDRFRLHVTPDYTRLVRRDKYYFFNKPFGIRHWMEHGLGLPQNMQQHEKMIVVLMDPDQFLMRLFERNMTNQEELWLTSGYRVIGKGQPMAARYAFGSDWMTDINVTELLRIQNLSVPVTHSGLLDWNHSHVSRHFCIGPPYLAVAHDMYAIVATWSDFVVPIYHQMDGEFLAEMFAYSTAAAHLNLPHQVAKSFMVSNTVSENGEPWKEWIDHQNTSSDVSPLPHVLHFCQRYYLGPYFFSKYQVPKGKTKSEGIFLSCEHALYQELPSNASDMYEYGITLNGEYHKLNNKLHMRRRMAFALTHVLVRLNAAATFYKQHHCTPENANYNKTFTHIKPSTIEKMRKGKK